MTQKRANLSPSFKIWLRKDSIHVLGKGGASILKAIKEYGSITEAAKRIGVSYKYAWDRLADIKRAVGHEVILTRRGGKFGGGGAELTTEANKLLKEYERTERYLKRVLKEDEFWEAIGLKISARNRLKGTVENIDKGPVASKVKIKIQTPITITAVITKEAVEDLEIELGDKVEAVIKATEVMVAKE